MLFIVNCSLGMPYKIIINCLANPTTPITTITKKIKITTALELKIKHPKICHSITNFTVNGKPEKRIIIKGSFGFTRDGVFGKTTNRLPIMANGRITSSGTFYLKQLCYTEGRDKCHDPSKWNLESID